MKRSIKKIIACILSLSLVCALTPGFAMGAADSESSVGAPERISGTSTASGNTEVYIKGSNVIPNEFVIFGVKSSTLVKDQIDSGEQLTVYTKYGKSPYRVEWKRAVKDSEGAIGEYSTDGVANNSTVNTVVTEDATKGDAEFRHSLAQDANIKAPNIFLYKAVITDANGATVEMEDPIRVDPNVSESDYFTGPLTTNDGMWNVTGRVEEAPEYVNGLLLKQTTLSANEPSADSKAKLESAAAADSKKLIDIWQLSIVPNNPNESNKIYKDGALLVTLDASKVDGLSSIPSDFADQYTLMKLGSDGSNPSPVKWEELTVNPDGTISFAVSGTEDTGMLGTYALVCNIAPDDENTYSITSSVNGTGGQISPEGIRYYVSGASTNPTYTFLPDAGYKVASVKVGGASSPWTSLSNIYEFKGQSTSTTIEVTFEKIPEAPAESEFAITVNNPEHGKVDIVGQAGATAGKYKANQAVQLQFTPDKGFEVEKLEVRPVGAGDEAFEEVSVIGDSYQIPSLTQDLDFRVVFAAKVVDVETETHTMNVQVIPANGNNKAGELVGGQYLTTISKIKHGAGVTLTFAPDAENGYQLSSVKVRETEMISQVRNNELFVGNIIKDEAVQVVFTKVDAVFTVELASGPNGYGSVSPTGKQTVAPDGVASIGITVNKGYKLDDLKVVGASGSSALNPTLVGTDGDGNSIYTVDVSYADIMAAGADAKLSVSFTKVVKAQYTISATNTNGGEISPYGDVTIEEGEDVTFQMTAFYGYKLSAVYVKEGTSAAERNVGAVASYTFKNVKANGSIRAEFQKESQGADPVPEPEYYNIQVNAGTGGTVSLPNNGVIVAGNAFDLSVIPDDGKKLSSVTLNGTPIDDVVSGGMAALTSKGFVTLDPTTNSTLREMLESGLSVGVSFENLGSGETPPQIVEYVYTATAGAGGMISPSGEVKVSAGAKQSFTITPYEGYEISSVKVDGKTISVNTLTDRRYQFGAADGNHSIEVEFSAVDISQKTWYKVEARVDGMGGTVSPTNVEVLAGSLATIQFFPSDGYKMSEVSIDGGRTFITWKLPEYVIESVDSNMSIVARFAKLPNGTDHEAGWDFEKQTITVSSSSHGKVSPSGTLTVRKGSSQKFSFIPDSGYEVGEVKLNGSVIAKGVTELDVLPSSSASTLDVQFVKRAAAQPVPEVKVEAKVEVKVEANVETVEITGDASDIVTVSPMNRTVKYGDDAVFYMSMNTLMDSSKPFYAIDAVEANGIEVDVEGVPEIGARSRMMRYDALEPAAQLTQNARLMNYVARTGGETLYTVYKITLPNVTNKTSVKVKLRQLTDAEKANATVVKSAAMHKLTLESVGGGIMQPFGEALVPEGYEQTVDLQALSGYYLQSVYLGDKDVTKDVSGGQYTVLMDTSDVKLVATFAPVGTVGMVNVKMAAGSDSCGVSPRLPGEFARGSQQTFVFTYGSGPLKDPVLDIVRVNGEDVPFIAGTNYANIKLESDSEIYVKFRERVDGDIEAGLELLQMTIVQPERGGKISPEKSFTAIKGFAQEFTFTPTDESQFMLTKILVDNCAIYPLSVIDTSKLKYSVETVKGTDGKDKSVISYEFLNSDGNGTGEIFTFDASTGTINFPALLSEHAFSAEFSEYMSINVQVKTNAQSGDVSGSGGFVMPKGIIKQAIDEPLPIFFAPYVDHEVEVVTFEGQDITKALRQTAAAKRAVEGETGKTVLAAANEVATVPEKGTVSKSTMQTTESSAAQRSNTGALSGALGVEKAYADVDQSKFAKAYEWTVTPDVMKRVYDSGSRVLNLNYAFYELPDEQQVDKLFSVVVKVIGGNGTLANGERTLSSEVEAGKDFPIRFLPYDGCVVSSLKDNGVDVGVSNNMYTIRGIDKDHTVEVMFGFPAPAGGDNNVKRAMRTLQSLAQTGDLQIYAAMGLFSIALVAIAVALFSGPKSSRGSHRSRRISR